MESDEHTPVANANKLKGRQMDGHATSRRLGVAILLHPALPILPQRRARHRVILAPAQGWASLARRRPPKEEPPPA
eukprot:8561849-Alexandrium_andersonii.AAC.1